METKLQKWGNSVGIRIPSSMLKSLNLKINDTLELVEQDNRIVITKSNKQKLSLKERFDNYSGPNLAEDFVWDDARGNELW